MLATAASAAPVVVTLGASSQNLTLYELGPSSSNAALGTFGIGQGASVYDAITKRSTFTLTGAITGGTAEYNSGTYSFVTTYAGLNTPMAGPNEPTGQSNPSDITRFFYTFIDPTTTITLTLFLGGQTVTQQLFANDSFVANTGFSFTFAGTPTCTGVTTCTQNNVGLTRGATIFGPTTISANFDVAAAAVPEPATWAMMISGFGAIGLAMRRRRRLARRSRTRFDDGIKFRSREFSVPSKSDYPSKTDNRTASTRAGAPPQRRRPGADLTRADQVPCGQHRNGCDFAAYGRAGQIGANTLNRSSGLLLHPLDLPGVAIFASAGRRLGEVIAPAAAGAVCGVLLRGVGGVVLF